MSDLHRVVARMAARLILFSDDTTRGEIVDNAALFADEVIETIYADLRRQVEALPPEYDPAERLHYLLRSDVLELLAPGRADGR